MASTLTGQLRARDRPANPRDRAWAQMWSHSSPSGAVHHRSSAADSRRSRTVAASDERGSALLESVLGATPCQPAAAWPAAGVGAGGSPLRGDRGAGERASHRDRELPGLAILTAMLPVATNRRPSRRPVLRTVSPH